jgi:hypothetical protein
MKRLAKPKPAKKPKDVEGCLPTPEFYYDKGSLRYWTRTEHGFLPINETSLGRRLKALTKAQSERSGLFGDVPSLITHIQDNFAVDYVGSVAGHPVGLYTYAGARILVESARPITQATYGNCSLVREYIERLLDPLQANIFHAWIKMSRESLLANRYDKFLALIIAGAPDHGKSRLAMLTQQMFNDTIADPYQNMSGATNFNRDLFRSVLLLIDDHGNNPRIESRRNLLNAFKQFTVGAVTRCEAKGKDAIVLDPFWRLLITINDSPKALQVLPEMESTLRDKVIMLKSVRRAVDKPTLTHEQQDAFWKPLVAGVPDYLGWLESWRVPAELQFDRFMLKAWQHPDLSRIVQSTSNEVRVLELIDDTNIWGLKNSESSELRLTENGVLVTVRELYQFFSSSPGSSERSDRDAERLIKSPGSLGSYLHELATSHPNRVAKTKQRVPGGPQFWLLKPPSGKKLRFTAGATIPMQG